MSIPFIIINLSGKFISLEYLREGGTAVPSPFPRGNWPMPLSQFSRRLLTGYDSNFVFDITKRIGELLEDSFTEAGELESLKGSLPILFMIENDVTDNDADSIKENFNKLGFANVSTLRRDMAIADYYARDYRPEGVVTASSDGKDLFISLSLHSQSGAVARKTLPGEACDPRAEDLANKIWEQVRDYTIDLHRENETAALTKAALDYLKSGKSELEGCVRLSDGAEYDYFVNRSMVNNEGTRQLQTKITEFLTEFGLADRSRSVIVLCGEAISSNYIRQSLTPGFGEVATLDGHLRDAILRLATNLSSFAWKETALDKPVAPPEKPSPRKPEYTQPKPYTRQPAEPEEEPETTDSEGLMPIELEASVESVKAGFMKRKKVLKIRVTSPMGGKIPWHSVLCVQEKPLSTIDMQNVVQDYDRGDRLPFSLELDLPLKQCPDAKRLRIYFKPHPDEPVGINNAYEVAPLTVNL
ncbi:MAG: hypothetical protein K2M27_02780 [Muribaculaceae bacterium]|nr:hypothetical protein [Muribaculaceae bacterium]